MKVYSLTRTRRHTRARGTARGCRGKRQRFPGGKHSTARCILRIPGESGMMKEMFSRRPGTKGREERRKRRCGPFPIDMAYGWMYSHPGTDGTVLGAQPGAATGRAGHGRAGVQSFVQHCGPCFCGTHSPGRRTGAGGHRYLRSGFDRHHGFCLHGGDRRCLPHEHQPGTEPEPCRAGAGQRLLAGDRHRGGSHGGAAASAQTAPVSAGMQ